MKVSTEDRESQGTVELKDPENPQSILRSDSVHANTSNKDDPAVSRVKVNLLCIIQYEKGIDNGG